jgi:signal transduction protein with GAF and PtsI domain
VETSISEVALLRHISSIVSSDRDVESILHELIGLTMNAAQPDACLVYLIDRATDEIVLRASTLPHDAEIGNVRMKMGEGITGWVAVNNAIVVLPRNAAADHRFRTFSSLHEDTYQALLSVPLVAAGDVIGVINVHHREPHQHSSDEVALALFIGEQMGGMIARARQAELLQSASLRMQKLGAVANAMSVENPPELILDAISQMVAQTLCSVVCSILLVNDKKRTLIVSAARCLARGYVSYKPMRMEGSLVEELIRKGRPIVIPNIHQQSQYGYPELVRRAEVMSLLAAPLISQRKVIGSINIYTRDQRSFSDDEIDFVKVAAGQAAIAIHNQRLMSETLDLKRRLEARKLIERAKGILQLKHNLTEEEAYHWLRNESRSSRCTMRSLAQELINAGGDLKGRARHNRVPIEKHIRQET